MRDKIAESLGAVALVLVSLFIVAMIAYGIDGAIRSDRERAACSDASAPYQSRIIDGECFRLAQDGSWLRVAMEVQP